MTDPNGHHVSTGTLPVKTGHAEMLKGGVIMDVGRPVAVRQGPVLGSAFHPELTRDLRLHREFLSIAEGDHTSLSRSDPSTVPMRFIDLEQ